MEDQDKAADKRDTPNYDTVTPPPKANWERIDMDDVSKSADDDDILASEEVETLDEEVESFQDDDDNPYQESDEALPDDSEEAAIGRDLLNRDKSERFGD